MKKIKISKASGIKSHVEESGKVIYGDYDRYFRFRVNKLPRHVMIANAWHGSEMKYINLSSNSTELPPLEERLKSAREACDSLGYDLACVEHCTPEDIVYMALCGKSWPIEFGFVEEVVFDQNESEKPLTEAYAKNLMRWVDGGSYQGHKTLYLRFHATTEQACKGSHAMTYATLSKDTRYGNRWTIDDLHDDKESTEQYDFKTLAEAKKAAVEYAIGRLKRDGYIATPQPLLEAC